MVIAGDLGQLPEPRNLVEDPHREVRMQPDSLELRRAQRTLFGPDLIGNSDAAQIVNVARAPSQHRRVRIEPGGNCGVTRQPGHRSRMSQCEWAFQVDEVAQRDE